LLTALVKKTTDQTVMKFYGTVGHYSGTERLYFGGNPDPNPGIPEGIFPLRLFRQQSENTQTNGLQIEETKGCLPWRRFALSTCLYEYCFIFFHSFVGLDPNAATQISRH